jgi:hypothetical protein
MPTVESRGSGGPNGRRGRGGVPRAQRPRRPRRMNLNQGHFAYGGGEHRVRDRRNGERAPHAYTHVPDPPAYFEV